MKKIFWGMLCGGLPVVLAGVAAWGIAATGQWLIAAAVVPTLFVIPWFGYKTWTGTKVALSEPPGGESEPISAVNQSRSLASDPPEVPEAEADEPDHLAQQLLRQGRYALLLRPQVAENLDAEHLREAMRGLDETMGIVPEGDVLLQSWQTVVDNSDPASQTDRLVHVEAVHLDRYPVTNEQYYQFVADGGYENMALWDQTIWPAVLDFVDRTKHPGPRFWENGCYPAGMEQHPVVGVSWYEGIAYARWVGKRLPSDPEWVKAGSWPVLTQGTRPMQRRYPWGDTLDRELAHLWGSGIEGTVPVDALPGGVSVGGIYQLIGNVWEWTTSSFGMWDTTARRLQTSTPMKSIRGGAYDTYFDMQATCQFQSGDSPIRRKHNIGFRCALAMCDVIPPQLESGEEEQAGDLVGCAANPEEGVQ